MLGALLALASPFAAAQEPDSRTWANPVDIDDRYNVEQMNEGISYRTGAGPVVVRYGDAYYLFLTLADGYWRSTDLLHWQFIAPSRWRIFRTRRAIASTPTSNCRRRRACTT